ncbi:penicillin-binding protein activator [Hydrocarboniphaga sp.]|uniref:penicillin-binding protein activator n=1 Tax=Hydrocarboniphaga sp. TaxID=2033016 RepID=UPI003D1099E2
MPTRVHPPLLKPLMKPRFRVALFFAYCLCAGAQAAEPPRGEQTLAAAEAAMNVGDDRKAENLLSQVPPSSLALPQIARAQILRSSISLKRNLPMAALQALPSGSDHVPLYAERIEDLRARALFQLGDPVAATRSLVLRERYLQGDGEALADNRELIWQGLQRTPLSNDDVPRIAVQDEITRGWLELAWQRQLGAAARYDSWAAHYPKHPAIGREAALARAQSTAPRGSALAMPSAISPQPAAVAAAPIAPGAAPAVVIATASAPFVTSGSGRGYALLLPLTGPFAATGEAVRAGFLQAAGAAANEVRVYDSGASPDQALVAYQNALSEGAAVIVGPLQREAVGAIARMGQPQVPMIALNALDEKSVAPANFLQFGLAPEDEARAAAEQAVAQNLRRAVALVPSSDWGRRVFAAFSDRLRELGGQLTGNDVFESGTNDPSKMIKRLLGLEASESRHKALTAVLGKDTEFDGRRRDDVDFVFLAAKPSDARVILPQLRFFRAGGLPIYSTSLIYEGRGIDWPSIRVCDMPWMLDSSGPWIASRNTAITQIPDVMRSYPRLVALGSDAWRLAGLLHDHRLQTEQLIDGASGRLRVDADGKVGRNLSCAAPNSALSQALTPAPAPPQP